MRKLLIIILILIMFPQTALPQSIFGLSSREEVIIGEKIAKDIEKQLPIYRDPAYVRRLVRVGQKLAHFSERDDIDYNFQIIERDQLNAFATFGGYIYIYKGAMDKASDDDELASILAHEIGHVSAKHLAQLVEKQRAFGLWFTLLDYFLLRKQKRARDIRRMIGIGYDIIQRGYSRKDELEADRLGTRFLHRAGYNPHAAIRVLNKLKSEKRGRFIDPFQNIGILRTHPFIDERTDAILSEIASIKAEESLSP